MCSLHTLKNVTTYNYRLHAIRSDHNLLRERRRREGRVEEFNTFCLIHVFSK